MGSVDSIVKSNNCEYLELRHKGASLELSLQGAHITSYKPARETELLWMSSSTFTQQGKAIRGGIPICWPWFGMHWNSPEDTPQHGFARVSAFRFVSHKVDKDSTRVVLALVDAPEPYNIVDMQVEIELSDKLSIQIRTTNKGDKPIEIGAALHTYFQLSHISQAQVPQLTGCEYKDKTREFGQFNQFSPLVVNQEIDRVYLNPPMQLDLVDAEFGRNIQINTWGNTDLVVWNPWTETAKAMVDFDDQGYQSMLCIEPANALDNRVILNPNEEHLLGKSIFLVTH